MNSLSQDLDRYRKAIQDLAHLIQVFGGREVLLDLHQFFPEQYEEMIAVLNRGIKTKQLARLLDANQSGCGGAGVASPDVASK
jgi:hypothetical protein